MSTDAVDVSIVIVAWRSREDVLVCLRSLSDHVQLSYEAIVVDDGS
jgi:glycosyltransferase involved in cell wall biosynthesis